MVLYQYTDSQWGDLLTSYNGRSFSYDAIGNLTNDGVWTYTWKHGRQLNTMSNGSTTWSYVYNGDGLRMERANNSNTTIYHYWYNEGLLSQMTVDGITMYITYDANGLPFTINYNGAVYCYVLNAFGDVIGLTNSAGVLVVEYIYDAWGNQIGCVGSFRNSLGKHNPLRYRSYIYDEETGLYYLQSRYYNPEIGRFINSDGFVSTGQGLLGNNMFVYCHNNPIIWCDPCGSCLHRIDFWNHCDECQGKSFGERVVGYIEEITAVHHQCQELDTRIRLEQIDAMQGVASTAYNFLDETNGIDIGASSYQSYQAARAFKKAAAYFGAPIPTAMDEFFAVGYTLKGLYHLCKSWEAIE